jgi:ABC-type phosphate/phosphonate transport system substrate-binding protein
MRHLMLRDEVVDAVANGQFHITTMNNVAEGILHITGYTLQEINKLAETKLIAFKQILEANSPKVLTK